MITQNKDLKREPITVRKIEKLFNGKEKNADKLAVYLKKFTRITSKTKLICTVWNDQNLSDEEVITLMMYFGKRF